MKIEKETTQKRETKRERERKRDRNRTILVSDGRIDYSAYCNAVQCAPCQLCQPTPVVELFPKLNYGTE